MNRKPGPYWINCKKDQQTVWRVAWFEDGVWWFPGIGDSYTPDQIEECRPYGVRIGRRIAEPAA